MVVIRLVGVVVFGLRLQASAFSFEVGQIHGHVLNL